MLAIADDVTYRPDYLAILPGYAMPSKAYGVTGTGVTLSGIYGRQFSQNWGFEVNAQTSTFETGRRGGTDFYQNGATLDLTYALFDRREAKLFTPFVLAGVGGVADDFYPNNRDGAAFIAEAGLGLVTRPLLAVGIRLRVDARYVHEQRKADTRKPASSPASRFRWVASNITSNTCRAKRKYMRPSKRWCVRGSTRTGMGSTMSTTVAPTRRAD